MTKAMVFTNHPKSVQSVMNERLQELGIEVVTVSQVSSNHNIGSTPVPHEVEVIVTMNSLVAQGAKDKIKLLAKRNRKRHIGLSQKLDNWKEEVGAVQVISGEDTNMARSFVTDEDLNDFCLSFIRGIDDGFKIDELIESCGQYVNPSFRIRDITHLINSARSVHSSKRCPGFFRKWWDELTHKVKTKKISPVFEPLLNGVNPVPRRKVVVPQKVLTQSEVNKVIARPEAIQTQEPPPKKAEPVPQVEKNEPWEHVCRELQEELKLYEESNQSLKKENDRISLLHEEDKKIIAARIAEVNSLKEDAKEKSVQFANQLAEQKALVAELRTQLSAAKARPTVKRVEDFVLVQSAVETLMRAGTMNKDEALKNLLQFGPLSPADTSE